MSKKLILPLSVLIFPLCFGATTTMAMSQDFLDLRIPEMTVSRLTMRQALTQLGHWGIRLSLEEVGPDQQGVMDQRITFSVQNRSIREILTLVTQSDPRYVWERYRNTNLVNVFPVNVRNDPDYVNNLRVAHVDFPSLASPVTAITMIGTEIPELSRRLHPKGGAMAGSYPGAIIGPIQVQIDFRFKDLTVRDILNEIVLRQDDLGWLYTPKPAPEWRPFP